MVNKFFVNGELRDKQIVAALERAAEGYRNGEIEETRTTLMEIVEAIDEWEALT